MKAHYMPGYYTTDNDVQFFRTVFIVGSSNANGDGSTALIKGDVNLTDNAHFMTSTYGHSPTDHSTFHSRDEFEKLASQPLKVM